MQTETTTESAIAKQLRVRRWQLMAMFGGAIAIGFMMGYATKGVESNRILSMVLTAYSDRGQDTRTAIRELVSSNAELADAVRQGNEAVQSQAAEHSGDTTRAARRSAEHARAARQAQAKAEAAVRAVEAAERRLPEAIPAPAPAEPPKWLDGP